MVMPNVNSLALSHLKERVRGAFHNARQSVRETFADIREHGLLGGYVDYVRSADPKGLFRRTGDGYVRVVDGMRAAIIASAGDVDRLHAASTGGHADAFPFARGFAAASVAPWAHVGKPFVSGAEEVTRGVREGNAGQVAWGLGTMAMASSPAFKFSPAVAGPASEFGNVVVVSNGSQTALTSAVGSSASASGIFSPILMTHICAEKWQTRRDARAASGATSANPNKQLIDSTKGRMDEALRKVRDAKRQYTPETLKADPDAVGKIRGHYNDAVGEAGILRERVDSAKSAGHISDAEAKRLLDEAARAEREAAGFNHDYPL